MQNIKSQFPIFQNHPNLVYLDSAASTQTPASVISAMDEYYTQYRSNIHRGLYDLSERATEEYEEARKKVAEFIQAQPQEIVFTSGTTQSLNLLAQSLEKTLQPGDNIVLTRSEHHANLLPWQRLAQKTGAKIRFLDLDMEMEDIDGDDKVFANMKNIFPVAEFSGTFSIDLNELKKCIDEKTKIVSFALVSNALGSIAPGKQIIEYAKKFHAITIVDAAQALAHMPVNVQELDCDFLSFSGHKMYGPTGIGVLYGKKDRLAGMDPYMLGGEMIEEVTYESATWAQAPMKFEAGTPNIAGAIGLGAAVDFIQSIGFDSIQEHENNLTQLFLNQMKNFPFLHVIGSRSLEKRIGVISLACDRVHPHDIADILNRDHVCVRAGHHCAMPLMSYLGLQGTTRISFGVYNTEEDVLPCVKAIKNVQNIFYGTSI